MKFTSATVAAAVIRERQAGQGAPLPSSGQPSVSSKPS